MGGLLQARQQIAAMGHGDLQQYVRLIRCLPRRFVRYLVNFISYSGGIRGGACRMTFRGIMREGGRGAGGMNERCRHLIGRRELRTA